MNTVLYHHVSDFAVGSSDLYVSSRAALIARIAQLAPIRLASEAWSLGLGGAISKRGLGFLERGPAAYAGGLYIYAICEILG